VVLRAPSKPSGCWSHRGELAFEELLPVTVFGGLSNAARQV
jgi:hypothetical protein